MNNEKKFLKPEANVIEFDNADIILTSGEWWGGGYDVGGGTGGDVPNP